MITMPSMRIAFAMPTMQIEMDRGTRAPLSWRDECIASARAIGAAAAGRTVVLGLSNGWDSEVVFHALRLAGVAFEVATVEMTHDLNAHDTSYVAQLCAPHDVRLTRHAFDPLSFVHEKLDDYAAPLQLTMPAIAMQLWLVDQILERPDTYPVLGGVPMRIVRRAYEEATTVEFALHSFAVARHLATRQRPGFPAFFSHSSEMMLAYLQHPMTRLFLRTSFCMRIGNFWRFRHPTYAHSFPELGPQRRNANGWELLRMVHQRERARLEHLYAERPAPYAISWQDLVRKLAHDPSALPDDPDTRIEQSQRDPLIWFWPDADPIA